MAPIATTDAIDHPRTQERHEKRRRLRELAHWYREFAERAGNPVIWEARLRTAKELEREADTLEEGSAQRREPYKPPGAPSPKRRRSAMSASPT